MFHIIASEQMFVNNLSQKIFLAAAASESNRFYQYFIYLYLIYLYFIALDYPT